MRSGTRRLLTITSSARARHPPRLTSAQSIVDHTARFPLARRDLASTYVETGEYAKARDAFGQVVAVAPDDYMTNYEMGFAEERLGLLKEARGHLETACRVAPESKQARKELDLVLGKMN